MPSVSYKPVLHGWRSLWERPADRHQRVRALARGAGQPVVVCPMFGAGPESTARLRHALDRAGFHPHDWGSGVDVGPRDGNLGRRLRRLEERVIDVFESEREPLTLVGWGLSGLYVREVAKRAAPLVRQVITLGAPFNVAGGTCELLRLLHDESGQVPLELARRLRERPPVPCTSIYSASDLAVPWQMCVETESPTSENVLVSGGMHRELADHPLVREIIADRLAQGKDEWRPYGR